MNGYTAGPWFGDVKPDGDNLTIYAKGKGDETTAIVGGCGCCGSPFTDPTNAVGNMNLMAAAPDLLEALHNALGAGLPEVVANHVRAAIAKAEGK